MKIIETVKAALPVSHLEQISRLCAKEDYWMAWTHKPFSIKEWTYASDGSCIARIPRVKGYEKISGMDYPANLNQFPWDHAAGFEFVPVRQPALEEFDTCDYCEGTGLWENQVCVECRGMEVDIDTIDPDKALRIGSHRLSLNYAYKLNLYFSGFKICPDVCEKTGAYRWMFDHGCGYVMPLSEQKRRSVS